MSVHLLDRARSGDGDAFEELVGPYHREIHVHCYRFLGSLADAEDAVQETLTAAWRGLATFEERASIRTWLYRIATSRCLNMLRAASRRPKTQPPMFDFQPPEPTRLTDVVWLEPYPDVLLADLPDPAGSPEAGYALRESISLAFVTALQVLPPQQRAVLILRDVLDFSAREVADLLETTEQSVTSALKRARATIHRQVPTPDEPPPMPGSANERELLSALVRAFEEGDVDTIVQLMRDDVWVRMPPLPLEYQGRELAKRFFATVAFRQDRSYRLIPTRANRQPAFGVYLRDQLSGVAHANGLFVITLAARKVSAITRFESGLFSRFGLPRMLTD